MPAVSNKPVAVDYTCYADTIYGLANLTGALPGAKKALAEIADRLGRALVSPRGVSNAGRKPGKDVA